MCTPRLFFIWEGDEYSWILLCILWWRLEDILRNIPFADYVLRIASHCINVLFHSHGAMAPWRWEFWRPWSKKNCSMSHSIQWFSPCFSQNLMDPFWRSLCITLCMLIHSDLQPTDPLNKPSIPSQARAVEALDPSMALKCSWDTWALMRRTGRQNDEHRRILPEKMSKDVETIKENSKSCYLYNIIVSSLSYCL